MKTILVVDDNFDNRNIISEMLKINGYQVVCADNGRIALDLVEKQEFDLVLMDLSMPIMDGWTATAELKSKPDFAHIPVIAVTGHVTSDELKRAQKAGCQDYLAKPIDYEMLVRKVKTNMAA
jgi:CheY-like chemotaxis protein